MSAETPSPSSPLRVLLVEDEEVSRHFLGNVLRSRGHEVDACPDGESGLERFREVRHPLVLLDRTLPGMSGIAVCREIRALPYAEDVVVLFVTGAGTEAALADALEAGADDYVVKPASPDLLQTRIAIAERRYAAIGPGRRSCGDTPTATISPGWGTVPSSKTSSKRRWAGPGARKSISSASSWSMWTGSTA